MLIVIAIIAGLAIIATGYLLHLLLIERKVSTRLLNKRDEIKFDLTAQYMENAELRQNINNLLGELESARQHVRQVERFSDKRTAELERSLRGANSIIEMFLEKFEGLESDIHISRKEARRLFVV